MHTLTLADLSSVLNSLSCVSTLSADNSNEITSDVTKLTYSVGTHVAGVWMNEGNEYTTLKLNWFIGVIESMDENGAKVSYMSQMNPNNQLKWKFPETANIYYTPFDQIIASNFPIEYRLVTILRCNINEATAKFIQNEFEKYMPDLN